MSSAAVGYRHEDHKSLEKFHSARNDIGKVWIANRIKNGEHSDHYAIFIQDEYNDYYKLHYLNNCQPYSCGVCKYIPYSKMHMEDYKLTVRFYDVRISEAIDAFYTIYNSSRNLLQLHPLVQSVHELAVRHT